MVNLITLYQQRLNLQEATFFRIDHEDAMVAIVYKVLLPVGKNFILKIYEHPNHYLRELYFLKYFANKLPVPQVIEVIPPETYIHAAILMECLPGTILKITDFTPVLAYEIGSLLAYIHLNRVSDYGDIIQQNNLNPDPRVHFTMKFKEELAECSNHLPKTLIEQCQHYYDMHINLLDLVDGPCIVHRDFRPGNIIAYNGKLQGIIDWASGCASFAQEDFCFMEHTEMAISSASKNAFLKGYASIRPVPDYNTIMPLLRLKKAIATIGFIVKSDTYEKNTNLYKFNRRFLETFF